MNYRNLPFECQAKSIDPLRVHLLLKLGDFFACSAVMAGFLLLSYAFFPAMFH